MVRRRQRGYSLIEIVVAMAIFGAFLAVVFLLTAEMRFWEKRLPLNMHKNPQVISVLSRLRRDVHDAFGGEPYAKKHDTFEASDKVLIVNVLDQDNGKRTIVWDFRTPGEVRRREYQVGVYEDWVSRGLPADFSNMEIDAIKVNAVSKWATRIIAKDKEGRIAIDTILQPRATK